MVKKDADKPYAVPEGIANYTLERKKDVARDMIRRTKLNNHQIADLTGVPINSVATMRGHIEGKLSNISAVVAERQKQAQETLAPGDEAEEERVELHDIDEKAPERRPEPMEKRVADIESGLNDLRSTFHEGLEEIKEMVRAPPFPPRQAVPPQGGGNGSGAPPTRFDGQQGEIKGQFEGIYYKMPISSRQVTLFEMWRAKNNKMTQIDPTRYKRFEGDIGDLITQLALPAFFKRFGATIKYVEEERIEEFA